MRAGEDEADPRIGRVLDGRYRIVSALAEGGMGAVYRGERLKLGREVAIKFLHAWAAADASFIKRFEVEAKAMARLQHPNCASVIDFGIEGHEPYVVMDLVGGVSLRHLLDDGPVPVPRAIEIARQVLAGLAHAHRQGIIHRDIKPENVMVEASELGDQVRVLDFGLAKMTQAAGDLTGGLVVGTPSYMSPEQSRGESVDAKADVYAVGVVLFEMLTGGKPFVGDDAGETMRQHREAPPPALAERLPGTPFSPALEQVVARALAKTSAERYTAAELAVALDELAGTPVRSTTMPTPPPPPPAPETMILDAVEMIPMTAEHQVVPSPVPVPVPAPAPTPAPASWTTAPAPATFARPGQHGRTGPFARIVEHARERWWLVAAGGLGLIALIVVIAILAGGGGRGSPAAAPPVREPDEIEMTDDGPVAPAELEALRGRIRGADTPQAVVSSLHRLALQHPRVAEIPLLLGQVYFARLWVDDGLEQFRKAIRIDPALREDPALIRATLTGLGNDSNHAKVRRFLANEVGAAAVPYLQGVIDGNWRKEVKERAGATLRDLGG